VTSRLRIAAVEPYFGGSHAHFLAGLQQHSRHEIVPFTLPPRQWKWRVRGAALHLARGLNADARFDVLLGSDFVNVPDLRALLMPQLRAVPMLYYLHENQLTYPLSPDEEFDPYFGFTNVLSCLSAEAVAFNSEFHRREFLRELPGFLPRLPDYEPRWVVDTIRDRARVLPVGLDLDELDRLRPPERAENRPRRVLWNHRWEFDKHPERFFAALEALASRNVPFVADVVGESFARQPPIFDAARARLGSRLGRFGFVASRSEYVQLLWQSDVVVSTAQQEFFGISMAEAVWCGAHPIAPRALVYEDLYGGPGSDARLYTDDAGLERLLERALTAPDPGAGDALRARLRAFAWPDVAAQFDACFESLHESRPHPVRPKSS
jgi:glycosyltransferase involved in cell wall biosynthesis